MDKDEFASTMMKMLDCIKAGDLDGLLRYSGELITMEPDNPAGYHFRVPGLVAREKYDEALSCANRAIELLPQTETYLYRGVILSKLRRYEEAITDLDKYLLKKPKDLTGRIARGQTFFHLKKWNECIHDLEKALDLGSREAMDYFYLGVANFFNKNYVKALYFLDKADPELKNETFFLTQRGIAHLFLSNWQKCIDDLSRAILLDPNYAMAYYGRSFAWFQLGNKHNAETDALKVEALNPELFKALVYDDVNKLRMMDLTSHPVNRN